MRARPAFVPRLALDKPDYSSNCKNILAPFTVERAVNKVDLLSATARI